VPKVAFPRRVHPCQWSNDLIAHRYLGIGAGLLLSFGLFLRAGWYSATVLLRPVHRVEAERLWQGRERPDGEFREVSVPGPLGGYPAWELPGRRGDTWVIAVHGRGCDRRESLRVLPALSDLGLPVLVVTYRNDLGAPVGPDGLYHLGDSEWADLAAAVDYARGRGARRVVLFGWSMGAAITGAYLDRAPGAAGVAAVLWDSPVLDWRATLHQQARLMRLPSRAATVLVSLVTRIAGARAGIDFDRFDLLRSPPSRRPPTLLIQGGADSAVPPAPGRALHAASAALGWPMEYLEVPGAEHTAGWNTDPAGYDAAVTGFLRRVVPEVERDRGTPQPATEA
jgi:uncharacterized protein